MDDDQVPPSPKEQLATTSAKLSRAGANNWAAACHLVTLTGLFTGVGFVLGPVIVWALKKDKYPEVDTHGKEVINFVITVCIAAAIATVLKKVLIGYPLFWALVVVGVVLPIIGFLKAQKGEVYRYPFTLRLLK